MIDLLAMGTGLKYGLGLAVAFKLVNKADEKGGEVLDIVKEKATVQKTLWDYDMSPTKQALKEGIDQAQGEGEKVIDATIDVTKAVLGNLRDQATKRLKTQAKKKARVKASVTVS